MSNLLKRPSVQTLAKLLVKYTNEELYKLYELQERTLLRWRKHLQIDPIINSIDVPDIVEHRKNGMSYVDLAYNYNTSVFVIECICRHRVFESFKKIRKRKKKYKNLKKFQV